MTMGSTNKSKMRAPLAPIVLISILTVVNITKHLPHSRKHVQSFMWIVLSLLEPHEVGTVVVGIL